MPTDPLIAVIDQLAAQGDRIGEVEAREAAHHAALSGQLTQLAAMFTTISRALAEDTAALTRLDDLDRQVTSLTQRLPQPDNQDGPAGSAPGDPAAGLRDWVERVYRPGYGHLAVLGPCWPQHPLCRYGLDILSRLHTALYPGPGPDPGAELLSAQAEYQARILPAIAAQLAAETTSCGHPAVTPCPGARP